MSQVPDLHIGDSVQCIFGNDCALEEGKVYRVVELFPGDLVGLNIWPGHLWWRGRFIVVGKPRVV
jgi:hypothetical protein